MSEGRAQLHAAITELITELGDGARDDRARNVLLCKLLAWQADHVPAYGRLVESRGRGNDTDPESWPALPTDVFRYTRVAAHAPREDIRVFRTSGTTGETRGAHPLRDLSLYDVAARTAARYALFPDVERMPLVVLAPRAEEARDSSLAYMLQRFESWFGEGETIYAWNEGVLDVGALQAALDRAQERARPVAMLGTSFAFVHAEDRLGSRNWVLPVGSRVMQTGGFKGRSRSVEPAELLHATSVRYGVAEPWIIQEYGMTELSSQLYENSLRQAVRGDVRGGRRLWVPGWMRAVPVDAESLRPVDDGSVGLLRVEDPANLDGVAAVQTADLAVRVEDGIRVLGRAATAVPRGCSIAVDQALGGA